jgi:hypothetical protein
VIDKEIPADLGTGVDFDPGKKAADMRYQSGYQEQPMLVKPMSNAMIYDSMKSRVA